MSLIGASIPIIAVPAFFALAGALIGYAGVVRLTDKSKPMKSVGDLFIGVVGLVGGVALTGYGIWAFVGR